MNGMQPDECTPEISWEVRYLSGKSAEPITVLRRDQGAAIDFAKLHRAAGREVHLFRVDKTEVEF